ncbi:MAG: GIY-YIG nuclease family protein [Actinobacteria bacterium]|nr:GIY-YIG nuclease family protein [Actinomycetota bacterium]
MVLPAPTIDEVLPSLLEFAGDAVIVGHNVRFDLSFLRAALERAERPVLANRWVDTCALARRLLRDEVPNCQLGTLASRFRLDHQPTHRALDDVLATADLLHLLLERAAGLGVMGLDDLLSLPKMGGHPQAAKLSFTAKLPREPGVYLFRDHRGQVLYVGKAANLRARVRSYFSSDTRRKIGTLLREAASVDHEVCANQLEAAVREVRLIHEHQPRYNRHAKDWKKYRWVKLTLEERFPRLAIARVANNDGGLYVGPVPSQRSAQRVIEAIQTASKIRRCTNRPGPTREATVCTPAQLGMSACPCSGACPPDDYGAIVDQVTRGLTTDHHVLLGPLARRLHELASAERYEEAADTRDRAEALVTALRRQRALAQLRRTRTMIIEWPGHGINRIHRGRLEMSWRGAQPTLFDDLAPDDLGTIDDERAPVPKDLVDELLVVASWLDRRAGQLRLLSCDGELVSPAIKLPSFQPRRKPP